MLNISNNSIRTQLDHTKFKALRLTDGRKSGRVMLRLLTGTGLFLLICLFLPWTQNIRSKGSITTLRPDQRPQTLHSVIGGRIEAWYVKEGDFVAAGDTILFLSEVKSDYFDPKLIERTTAQMQAKRSSVQAYLEKINALEQRITALQTTQKLKQQQAANKLRQARLKVVSDSIDFEAARLSYTIAQEQYKRMETMQAQGLKSLTDLEGRRLTLQKADAKRISAENKWLTSQNAFINAQVERASVTAQYQDYIAKSESEKFTAMSDQYDAEAALSKLQNLVANYEMRSGHYYLTAPQDGTITKAIQVGIGETVKEGTAIASIMPIRYDLAVAMYIKPIDLPLLEKGQRVRIQFDGWPAIVFSGWPNTSYGTYGGQVFAIDNFISDNGMFRVLVAPDPEQPTWPDALRVGGGTNAMILLNDVPIWYELWRQINGFPPDYYKTEPQKAEK